MGVSRPGGQCVIAVPPHYPGFSAVGTEQPFHVARHQVQRLGFEPALIHILHLPYVNHNNGVPAPLQIGTACFGFACFRGECSDEDSWRRVFKSGC